MRSASSDTPTRTAPPLSSCPDKLDDDVIAERVERVTALVEEISAQRAEDRIGTRVTVLVDDTDDDGVGRGEHQAPEVDGARPGCSMPTGSPLGTMVRAEVIGPTGST